MVLRDLRSLRELWDLRDPREPKESSGLREVLNTGHEIAHPAASALAGRADTSIAIARLGHRILQLRPQKTRTSAPLAASPSVVLYMPLASVKQTPSGKPDVPAKPARRQIGFQASIAEFLLINRLRARQPSELSADVLERAANIVFVTCQDWFAPPERDDVRNHTRP